MARRRRVGSDQWATEGREKEAAGWDSYLSSALVLFGLDQLKKIDLIRLFRFPGLHVTSCLRVGHLEDGNF